LQLLQHKRQLWFEDHSILFEEWQSLLEELV